MSVEIHIEGLEVYGYHGVLPEERVLGQHFRIDACLVMNECPGARTDRIEDTIDYTEAVRVVTEVVSQKSYNLIEKLANELGAALLERLGRADRVWVRVSKPKPPIAADLSAVAVSLELTRGRVGSEENGLQARPAVTYLSLGSNQGPSAELLRGAIGALESLPGSAVAATSRVYRTEPQGVTDQPDFLNQVVRLDTWLSPHELLSAVKEIERRAGRLMTRKWGPRTLDIDIVWYDGVVMKDERLELPHPLLEERRFVLEPLSELAPDLVLPSGRKVSESLARTLDQAAYPYQP